jgi:hypothetical protein
MRFLQAPLKTETGCCMWIGPVDHSRIDADFFPSTRWPHLSRDGLVHTPKVNRVVRQACLKHAQIATFQIKIANDADILHEYFVSQNVLSNIPKGCLKRLSDGDSDAMIPSM